MARSSSPRMVDVAPFADQWHPTANAGIDRESLTIGSSRKVVWQCRLGHSWRASTKDRMRNPAGGCGICSGKQILPGFNDLATLRPDLTAEWHPTKNGDRTPQNTSPGSHRPVMWQCLKGHEPWPAAPKKRQEGQGCPSCAGKRPVVGVSDLATTHPRLAAEWHPTKNGDLTPQDVTHASMKDVWWLGPCGHSWPASPGNRTQGAGCRYCTGRGVLPGFNDLATTHAWLAAEWHPTKNGDLTPQDVSKGSSELVHWIGPCGHDWPATVYARVGGRGCTVCAGKLVQPGINDLATLGGELVDQWHPTKNGDLTPRDVTVSSGRRVHWVCDRGHEWEATVAARTKGRGCRYCTGREVLPGFNDLATVDADAAAQWHPTKNGDLTPRDVTVSSGRRVHWVCDRGHEWETTVASRTASRGCRRCTAGTRTSQAETRLRTQLEALGIAVTTERFLDVAWGSSTLAECDMILPETQTVVEYDGRFWHRDRLERDLAKTRALLQAGWRVIRAREIPLPSLELDHPMYGEILHDPEHVNAQDLARAIERQMDQLTAAWPAHD